MSCFIIDCDAPRRGGSGGRGKSAAREMITTRNARKDFVLMHAGTCVPSIRDGFGKKHPKAGL